MNHPRSTANAYAGFHRCPGKPRDTIEVYYKHRSQKRITELAGWYWRPSPFDPLIDEETGPFTSSRAAYRNACNVEK